MATSMSRVRQDSKTPSSSRTGPGSASAAARFGYRPLPTARANAETSAAACCASLAPVAARSSASTACMPPYITAKPLISAMTSIFALVSSREPASSPRK